MPGLTLHTVIAIKNTYTVTPSFLFIVYVSKFLYHNIIVDWWYSGNIFSFTQNKERI